MTCGHTPAYPDVGSCPSLESALAACSIVDSHERLKDHPRAVTVPEGNKTLLDSSFWQGCSQLQRACVVSHERAHVVIGLDCPCECCADKVGGYMMRVWGFTTDAIRDGFRSLRVPMRQADGSIRDAAAGAAQGAGVAVRGLAARGLLGTVASREDLLKSKAALTAPASVGAIHASAATVLESASGILGARTASTGLRTDANKLTSRLTKLQAPTAPTLSKAAPKPTDPIRAPIASGKVVITDPSFVSPRPDVDAHLRPSPGVDVATQLKIQVAAGVIVALIIAVVIGAGK